MRSAAITLKRVPANLSSAREAVRAAVWINHDVVAPVAAGEHVTGLPEGDGKFLTRVRLTPQLRHLLLDLLWT